MKALEILAYLKKNDYIMDLLDKNEVNEAITEIEAHIAELEALQTKCIDNDMMKVINDNFVDLLDVVETPKSCDGCKYESVDGYCEPCNSCVRLYSEDYYKPKDSQ
jgi:hypothetical protein